MLLLAAAASTYGGEALYAHVPPEIDGIPGDTAWLDGAWTPIDKPIVGAVPGRHDFNGRYKAVWTRDSLYLLVEFRDDVLIDVHADPLDNYWNDDALEIFVDEDASGGLHLDNHSAFAYHVGLDNQIVDIDTDGAPALFNDHVDARWQRSNEHGGMTYWEARVAVMRENGTPAALHAGKMIGFMLAYCDADSPAGREHMIGDVEIAAVDGDRNRGYIDAGVFGQLTLRGD